jgi:outer membrane protein OmpA-like peptidoglycan-associated protein
LAVLCVFSPGVARAEPVALSLQNQVPAGKKPTITIVAKEAVTAIQLDIERLDDKKTFHHKAGPLAVGAQTILQIGDGKSGRARWKGRLIIRAASGETSTEVTFESNAGGAASGMKIGYDRAHLDLEGGKLEFTINQPAKSAELAVIGDDGAEQARVEKSLQGERPGQWIAITWKPAARPVLRLELRVANDAGDAVIARLVPWSVSIAHEEVIFPSGSAQIPAGEAPKLDASYQKIVDAVDKVRKHEPKLDVRVYVAGHTDTVGGSDDNRKLSAARAKAIAAWYRDRGLPLPLYFAGFGEDQPKVKTGDNVDEARNRRADYVVGVEEPANGRGRFVLLR